MSQHIHSFALKDTLLFKDFNFEIKPGLAVIYGLNRTNGLKSMQANGAGKSSAFASLGEILYDEPIVGLKEDTNKMGTRSAVLKLGKRVVEIVHKGNKLEVLVDGKAKQFRKKPDAQKWIKEKLPMSAAEFNTYAFLDARVPHPLVMGSSTDRKKFFTDAFGLDRIDVERRLFEAELSKLKKIRIAYAELRSVFDAEKEKVIPKEERQELQSKLRAYEEEIEDLNRKAARLEAYAHAMAFEKSAAPQLKAFEKLCPVIEEFSSIYSEVEANLRDNRGRLRDARQWEEYVRDSKVYEKAVAALSNQASSMLGRRGLEEAMKRCKDAADQLSELKEEKEKADRHMAKKPSKPEPLDRDEPNMSRKQLLAEAEKLEHQIEHAEKFKKGVCKTCGQDVAVRDPAKLKKQLAKIEADLEAWAEIADYREAHDAYTEWRDKARKIKADTEDLDARISAATKRRAIYRELRDLPTPPEKFKGRKLEVNVCERMVEEDREQLALLEFMQPNLDTVQTLRQMTEKQRAASLRGEALRNRLTTLHERMSKIQVRLEVNSESMANLRRHRERLVEMKDQLKEEEALKLLVEAYSDKSIKRMAIKSISTRLMAEVNKYAKLIFPEDYEFDFSWESSKLQLLVYRKYRIGKKTKILASDVRKLSGAESKLFTFLLVLALLTFVPQRKRSNVLVLDEPDAAMSAETTDSFKKLLPLMNRVIPSIIVITPRTEQRYEGATEYTVLKENGEARLVEGHPLTIK